MHVGGIFCYLARAVDCINHELLLAKLHFCSIRELRADWFRSYPTKRKQKVKSEITWCSSMFLWVWFIKTWRSPRVNAGALLAIIYINYLTPRMNSLSEPIIFADDTSVIISNKFWRFLYNVKLNSVSYDWMVCCYYVGPKPR
jgi:hypothetical protein